MDRQESLKHRLELRQGELGGGVGEGLGRVVVDFQKEAVHAGGDRGASERLGQLPPAAPPGPLPPPAPFSMAFSIPQGETNCPFLMLTTRPDSPAATSRSVCRDRNAGICR